MRVRTHLVVSLELVHDLREVQLAVDLGLLAEVRVEQQVVATVLHRGHDQVPAAVRHFRTTVTTDSYLVPYIHSVIVCDGRKKNY